MFPQLFFADRWPLPGILTALLNHEADDCPFNCLVGDSTKYLCCSYQQTIEVMLLDDDDGVVVDT